MVQRLTLTWDVLKFIGLMYDRLALGININMRCIEIVEGVIGEDCVLD